LRKPGSKAIKKMIRTAARYPVTWERSLIQDWARYQESATQTVEMRVERKNLLLTGR
jgi:hypothetical protein